MQSLLPRLTHTNMSVVNNIEAAVTVGFFSCHGIATLDFIDRVSDCWKVTVAVTVCLGGTFSF